MENGKLFWTTLRSIKLWINFLGVFPWFLLALWSENLHFCASLISYPLLTARNSKEKVFAKYQSGSCQDGLKLQNTAMQLLSFIFLPKSYKTVDLKIQHFRRWVEFVIIWEIWILNLEGRSRCIYFCFYWLWNNDCHSSSPCRVCKALWKCPFNPGRTQVSLCHAIYTAEQQPVVI